MSALDHARTYAERGWPVFPLVPGEKRPATRNGFHDATTDLDRIEQWWTTTPDAGIGLPTGIAFDVLDIDHEDYAVGVADLPDCTIESAPLVRTGSGKWHLYVQPTGLGRRVRFSRHCDWLGTDGYVIAPPSVHPEGDVYAWWEIADTPVGPDPSAVDLALSQTPRVLIDFIERPPAPTVERAAILRAGRLLGRTRSSSSWSAVGLIGTVVTAQVGERNQRLHWAACRVGEDLRAGKAPRNAAEAACDELVRVAVLAGLGEREAVATVQSGFGRGVGGAA